MTKLNKPIWMVGHVLSRRGLIDAACQMRGISQAWHTDPARYKTDVFTLLDDLYLKDNSICQPLWEDLKYQVLKAEETAQSVS